MSVVRPLPIRHLRRRRAFTLVELLVSMVIVSIIAGMVAIARSGAQRQALDTRARGFVDRLNLMVLQLYETETRRAATAVISTPQPFAGMPNPNSLALKSRTLAVLNWKRDYLRCALPDRIQDLKDAPIDVYYRLHRGLPPAAGGEGVVTALARMDPAFNPPSPPPVPPSPPSWASVFTASIRWQMQERFRARVLRTVQSTAPMTTPTTFAECVDGSPANGEWTSQYQSAECLYLTLSIYAINGVPAVDSLRPRQVGDVDQDGIPEVLDPWGVPMGYLRWPCGYHVHSQWQQELPTPLTTTELAARKIELRKDTLDVLYSDPRYDDTVSSDYQADDPFLLAPIVVSAGADGLFDMIGLDEAPSPPVDYATGNFPVAPTGTLGFPGSPKFIDPYQFGVPIEDQLGAMRDTVELRTDNSADNVFPSFDVS